MANICDRPNTNPPIDPDAHSPIVALLPLSGYGVGTVTLNGSVDPQLANTSWRFEWGPTPELGRYTPNVDGEVPIGTLANVSAILTGLDPNRTYYYRLHASNGVGVSDTSTQTFTSTPPTVVAPVVTVAAASAITSTGAHLSGTVNPGGETSLWHFHVETNTAGSVRDPSRDFGDMTVGAGNSQVQYSPGMFPVGSWTQCAGCSVPTPDSSYVYGYTAGDTMTLRFNGVRLVMFAPDDNNGAASPTITVDGTPASISFFQAGTTTNGIRFDTGVLGASNANHTIVITVPAGPNPVVLFDHAEVYVASGAMFSVDFPAVSSMVSGVGPQPVAVDAIGLTPSTLYSYYLEASNSAGTVQSATLSFTTGAGGGNPIITPQTPGNITGSTANVRAQIDPNGSATAVGVDYGPTAGYGTTVPGTPVPAGAPLSVALTLSSLPPATVVHYRWHASNAGGTTNEPDQALTTLTGGGPSTWWPFGFALDTNTPAATDEAQANISAGRPMTVCECFPTRDNGWGSLANLSGQPDAFLTSQRTRLVMVPPYPENDGSNWDALLNGEYDGYYRQWGTRLRAREDAGYPPDIIAIFWEFNYAFINAYRTPLRFIQGYQRCVNRIRDTYPNVQTAWVINGWSDNTDSCYPGDSYVTFAGGDWYDFINIQSRQDFLNHANAMDGPLHTLNNIENNWGPDPLGRPKKLIVPEWSIVAGYSQPADKPLYIQCMVEEVFMRAQSTARMGPESLWNSFPGSPWDIYYSRPNCRAMYTQLYRP